MLVNIIFFSMIITRWGKLQIGEQILKLRKKRINTGETYPDLEQAGRIAKHFNTSLDNIVGVKLEDS